MIPGRRRRRTGALLRALLAVGAIRACHRRAVLIGRCAGGRGLVTCKARCSKQSAAHDCAYECARSSECHVDLLQSSFVRTSERSAYAKTQRVSRNAGFHDAWNPACRHVFTDAHVGAVL